MGAQTRRVALAALNFIPNYRRQNGVFAVATGGLRGGDGRRNIVRWVRRLQA